MTNGPYGWREGGFERHRADFSARCAAAVGATAHGDGESGRSKGCEPSLVRFQNVTLPCGKRHRRVMCGAANAARRPQALCQIQRCSGEDRFVLA